MDISIALRVPEADKLELEELIGELGGDSGDVQVSKPFDGETVAQVLLVLGATYPYFRSWLVLRGESRKAFSIVHNGTEMKGYSAAEAKSILQTLEATDDAAALTSGKKKNKKH